MAYFDLLVDEGMNYTANRPLIDGEAAGRVDTLRRLAPGIVDFASWSSIYLDLAQQAEADEQWLDAATYYHQAEFYLPAGEVRNGLYDDFARNFAQGMDGVDHYERIEVPYGEQTLPGFRLPADAELGTFVFNGGYDSFVEEFYPFLLPLRELGFTVVGFDGPGQGGALRRGLHLTHEWEKPVGAVLDHFGVEDATLLGASCGGLLAIRAAAFEPRIRRVVALPASYSGLDMPMRHMFPGQARGLHSLLFAEDEAGVEALVARERTRSLTFEWCMVQGMHITGTASPYGLLQTLAMHSLNGILHRLDQDVLLTEGEHDHLFDPSWIHREMEELTNARSVTARIFTAREGAEQHCQVGNSGLARDTIVHWLTGIVPGLTARLVAANGDSS
jgi:pimeloyl-ACP methyl ester carboxylesterase